MPLKIVCDTNTLISGFLWKGNEFLLLSSVLEGKAVLFLSPVLLQEFARVIAYPRLKKHVPKPEDLIKTLESMAVFVSPKELVAIVEEDPSDDRVLECALAADADLIVSGDEHLLKLRKFCGIPVVSTKAALEKM